MRRLAFALFAAATVAGCAGTYAASTDGTITTASYTPDLVYVSPGVQVVADYDEPVFYSNNSYWRYDSGRWYRSRWHNRGWVHIHTPPVSVTRIERPYSYRHYRPAGYVRREHRGRWRAPDRDRPRRPDVRDHRRR